jgi:hypothetical protein
MRRRLAFAALAALGVWAAFSNAAQAALFDDDEARKQIIQLRNQAEARQKSIEERLSSIDAKLGLMDSSGQNRVVDLAQLIESLKQDMAKLRGQIEVLANQTETLERRQKDLYVDLDTRLRRIEQTQTQLRTRWQRAQRRRGKAGLRDRVNQFKLGNQRLSITTPEFHDGPSNSELPPSAQYWMQRLLRHARLQVRDRGPAEARSGPKIPRRPTRCSTSPARRRRSARATRRARRCAPS